VGEHYVQQQQIAMLHLEQVECLPARRRSDHGVAIRLEVVGEELPCRVVVLHDHDRLVIDQCRLPDASARRFSARLKSAATKSSPPWRREESSGTHPLDRAPDAYEMFQTKRQVTACASVATPATISTAP